MSALSSESDSEPSGLLLPPGSTSAPAAGSSSTRSTRGARGAARGRGGATRATSRKARNSNSNLSVQPTRTTRRATSGTASPAIPTRRPSSASSSVSSVHEDQEPTSSRQVSLSPELMAPDESNPLIALVAATSDGIAPPPPSAPELRRRDSRRSSSSLSEASSSKSPSPPPPNRAVGGSKRKGKRPSTAIEDDEDDEEDQNDERTPRAGGSENDPLTDEEELDSLSSAESTSTVGEARADTFKRGRGRPRGSRNLVQKGRQPRRRGRPAKEENITPRWKLEASLTPVRATRATVTLPPGYIEGVKSTRLPKPRQGSTTTKDETPTAAEDDESDLSEEEEEDDEEEEAKGESGESDEVKDEADDASLLGAVTVDTAEMDVELLPVASQATTTATFSRPISPSLDGTQTPANRSESADSSSTVKKTDVLVVVDAVDGEEGQVDLLIKEEDVSVEPEALASPRKKGKAKGKASAEPEREANKRRRVDDLPVERVSVRSAARRAFLDKLDAEMDKIKSGEHPLVPAACERLKVEKGLRLEHARRMLVQREKELGRQLATATESLWTQWADDKDSVRLGLYLDNHEKLKSLIQEEKTYPFLRDHPLLINHHGLPPAPYYRAPVLEDDHSFVPRIKFAASGHFLQPPPLDNAIDHSTWQLKQQDIADDLALFAGYDPNSAYRTVPPPIQPPATIAPPAASSHAQHPHHHPQHAHAAPGAHHSHHHHQQQQLPPPGQMYGYPPPPGYYYDPMYGPPPGPAYGGPPPPAAHHGWHGEPYGRAPPPREEPPRARKEAAAYPSYGASQHAPGGSRSPFEPTPASAAVQGRTTSSTYETKPRLPQTSPSIGSKPPPAASAYGAAPAYDNRRALPAINGGTAPQAGKAWSGAAFEPKPASAASAAPAQAGATGGGPAGWDRINGAREPLANGAQGGRQSQRYPYWG